ncbi:MAG: hypothetical protein ABGX27_01720 [Desulfurobacteriaceae bacterium]
MRRIIKYIVFLLLLISICGYLYIKMVENELVKIHLRYEKLVSSSNLQEVLDELPHLQGKVYKICQLISIKACEELLKELKRERVIEKFVINQEKILSSLYSTCMNYPLKARIEDFDIFINQLISAENLISDNDQKEDIKILIVKANKKKNICSKIRLIQDDISIFEKKLKDSRTSIEELNKIITISSIYMTAYNNILTKQQKKNLSSIIQKGISKKCSKEVDDFLDKNLEMIESYAAKLRNIKSNILNDLATYLINVGKTNSDLFINKLLSSDTLVNYFKSDNKTEFLINLYQDYFLNRDMLQDAMERIYEYNQQLADQESRNLLYLLYRELYEYTKLHDEIAFTIKSEPKFNIDKWDIPFKKSDILHIDLSSIEALKSNVNKILILHGVNIVSLPLNLLLSLITDALTSSYNDVLRKNIEKLLAEMLVEQYLYIKAKLELSPYGIDTKLKQTFENTIKDFQNQAYKACIIINTRVFEGRNEEDNHNRNYSDFIRIIHSQ